VLFVDFVCSVVRLIILQSMLVLALDTTTRAGSCAVARDGIVLRETAGDASRPHDTRLPGDLMTLLETARIALSDIDVFAVATGPGSFTGLRIGIATMQGLAFAAGKPLIGVSGFDAWRGEVYAALYEDGQEVEPPTVEHPDTLLARYSPPVTFIGDAADIYEDVIIEKMGKTARIAEPAAPPLAGTIALLATESARAGHLPPPHAIRPLYVRRPDAELARDARPVR
jgi:tRNA threonylcarbamoyladenosine biosynthesis protein TsaB